MNAEKWLPVPGFEGLYEISDHGRVQKIAPWCDGLNYYATRIVPVDRMKDGHFRVGLYDSSKKGRRKSRRVFVHQLVMRDFVGPVPSGHIVNHKDNDPTNNRLGNLEYATHSANTIHAFRLLRWKTYAQGEKHEYAKLKDADIPVILERLSTGEPIVCIARDFNVCMATISDISRNKTWRHIQREALPDRRFILRARLVHPL